MFRLGEYGLAERLLIAHLAKLPQSQQLSPLALLAWIRLENRDIAGFRDVFRTLQRTWADQPHVRALMFKFLLVTRRGHSIDSSPSEWMSLADPYQRQIFLLLHTEWLIVTGRVQEARSWLDLPLQNQSLEASILSARCDKAEGNLLKALGCFTTLLERAPTCFQLWLYALETALDARYSEAVLTLAKNALQRFGENPRLMQHLTPIKMLQRQPGLARRSALLQKLWTTTLRYQVTVLGISSTLMSTMAMLIGWNTSSLLCFKIHYQLSRNTAITCFSWPVLSPAVIAK